MAKGPFIIHPTKGATLDLKRNSLRQRAWCVSASDDREETDQANNYSALPFAAELLPFFAHLGGRDLSSCVPMTGARHHP
jgi:hypothetical protein